MSQPNSDAWKETTTGRERVRMVVESLEAPHTVTEIATEADVAWDTADSELGRMMAANLVDDYEVDGQTKYGPNLVRQFLRQVLDLIAENDREVLERQLVTYQDRLESLRSEHEARSAREFRERLAGDNQTAEEMREIRNVASTWEAIETEIRLRKQALNFYDDVTRLSGSADDRGQMTV